MAAKTKRRIKPKFYIILVVFLALLGGGIYLLVSLVRDGELEAAAARMEYPAKTVLLRDEKIVTAERFDKILFDVVEGATVQDGDQIAQVFKWGYQDDTMQTLLEIRRQIYEYQLQQVADLVKTDLDALQESIRAKLLEIRTAAQANTGRDMLTLEQELKALMEQRAQMLREMVQPDENLTILYQQESVQLNNLATWKSDRVNTAGSGLVSFYFDGYEQALATDKLEMINADLIGEVLKGSGTVSGYDASIESPLYRLVNSAHFYLAFLTEAADPFRLVAGEGYTVVFNGYPERSFTGIALAPVIGEKQVVNLIEFQQDMGDLMGVRVVDATILKDVSGVRVPLTALDYQENAPGILRVSGEDTQWIQVDVLAIEGNDAIVRAARPEQALTAGMRYKKKK